MLLCQLTNIGGMPATVVCCSYDREHSRPSTACTEMLAWFRSQLMKGAWTGLHTESWKARGGFPESVADQKMVSQYMFVKWEAERNGQFSSSRYPVSLLQPSECSAKSQDPSRVCCSPWALSLNLIHCIKVSCLWSALTTKPEGRCLIWFVCPLVSGGEYPRNVLMNGWMDELNKRLSLQWETEGLAWIMPSGGWLRARAIF